MVQKKAPFEQRRSNYKKHKPRRKKRRILLLVFLLFLIPVLAAGAVATNTVVNYINEAPPLDHAQLATVETSYLYDRHGLELTALHEEQNRVVIDLEELPPHVIQAFIAIEDERYYDHFGFDIIGSLRAAYANFRAGSIVQGASTISQQLAQNAFLTTETSYERKIQEIWLAIQLERSYGKDEILEMYLNRIYFGSGAYGIEAAAHTYFNKTAAELSTAEAALLAGLIRSPNFYNPFNNPGEAERRMRTVLSNMKRLEFIDESEYEQALAQRLTYGEPRVLEEYPHPYFVDYVVHHELIRILSTIPTIGSREEAYRAIYTGGLRVYTSLDRTMQSHVEEVLSREDLYPSTEYYNMAKAREVISALPAHREPTRAQKEELIDEDGLPQPQAAIVLANPNSGQILALGGGRDYQKRKDEVLRFTALRQPGSAIKPIVTYGPAFEEGILSGAGATLDDSPYIGPREDWFPENVDYRFRGMVTVREALVRSHNIPAIRAFEALGPRVGAEYGQKMGLSTLHAAEMDNLSLTLGGLTYGVSAIDMAQAYSVFANMGMRIDLHTVEKVVDRQGNVLYEYKLNPRQVLSPQAAFLVNDILQDFVTSYLGREHLQLGRPLAAKTGTTDKWRDVYLVAYAPNVVASFWMGYDEPRLGSIRQGWRYSTPFLAEVFKKHFETLDVAEFVQPEGIVRSSACTRSGQLPTEDCHAAETVSSDFFIAGLEPLGGCEMHRGRFYDRPPYITTDERWSSSGGPDRIPEDVEESREFGFFDRPGRNGSLTTSEINTFRIFQLSYGITLRWSYDGPPIIGFELTRTAVGDVGSNWTVELDPGERQFVDQNFFSNQHYTYSLAARYEDGSLSEPAVAGINTGPSSRFDGESEERSNGDGTANNAEAIDDEYTVVPNLVGAIEAVAENRADRAGVQLVVLERVFSDTYRRGEIVAQDPEPGEIVARGSEVTVTVSQGRSN